jgi:hypothetical protein
MLESRRKIFWQFSFVWFAPAIHPALFQRGATRILEGGAVASFRAASKT